MKQYLIQEAAHIMGRSRSYVEHLVLTEWKGKCLRMGGKKRTGMWSIPATLVEAWIKNHDHTEN